MKYAALVILVSTSLEFSEACFGLGGCGFGGMCCFAGGMGCGCTRLCARAKSPDEDFLDCCKERGLPAACLDKCSYTGYSANALRNMFLRTDECPVHAANDIHLCATRGRDHRQCCMRNGVTATLAGERCLMFCDKPPENQTQLDFTYLPCYDRFETMKGCFWKDALEESGIRFNPEVVYRKPMYRNMIPEYMEF